MGFLEVVVGDPGMGKTYYTTRVLVRRLVASERPRVVLYHSPNEDDAAPGFLRATPGQLARAGRIPALMDGVGCVQLLRCRGLDAVRLAVRWSSVVGVLLVLDELHRALPNYGQTWQETYTPEERQELRVWGSELLRMGRHSRLSVVGLSPTIAGVNPEVWRFARATHYFHQHERGDLQTIERAWGARAALDVARLGPRQFIRADRANPPPGWTGYRAELERKV